MKFNPELLSKNPLVSIYIPSYNRSEMLLRAIGSALNQTYKNIELIVVNDGSTDDTAIVLSNLTSTHKNITVINNQVSVGACAARNIAIKAAKGEFITGLDDDDEFTANRVAIFLKHYNPKYAFLAASITEDDGVNRINLTLDSGEIMLKSNLIYNKVGNQIFCERQKVIAVGGFDEEFPALQDYDLWTRLLEKYGCCLKLRETTYIMYTGHEKLRITSNPSKRLKALNMFIEKHGRHFTKANYDSFELLKKDILNEPLSTFEYFKLFNFQNIKPITGLYLDSHFRWLKSVAKILRK